MVKKQKPSLDRYVRKLEAVAAAASEIGNTPKKAKRLKKKKRDECGGSIFDPLNPVSPLSPWR